MSMQGDNEGSASSSVEENTLDSSANPRNGPTITTESSRRIVQRHFNVFVNVIGHDAVSSRAIMQGLMASVTSAGANVTVNPVQQQGGGVDPTQAIRMPAQNMHIHGMEPSTSWNQVLSSPGTAQMFSAGSSQQPQPSPGFFCSPANYQYQQGAAQAGPSSASSVSAAMCQICGNTANRKIRGCGHAVCLACVGPWFRIKKCCPNPRCKAPADLDHLVAP